MPEIPWCNTCRGALTRSKHTPGQTVNDLRCSSCYYNDTHPNASLLELGELEHLLAEAGEAPEPAFFDQFVGRLVDWHGTPVCICLIKGVIRLEHEVVCTCGKAGPTIYLGPGIHDGAWPYAYDGEGTYLANLRDDEYVCETCLPQHQAALERINAMQHTSKSES
jgi:hypothetical protein